MSGTWRYRLAAGRELVSGNWHSFCQIDHWVSHSIREPPWVHSSSPLSSAAAAPVEMVTAAADGMIDAVDAA